jgi:staphylococcal nuclease domain-containing protein 1
MLQLYVTGKTMKTEVQVTILSLNSNKRIIVYFKTNVSAQTNAAGIHSGKDSKFAGQRIVDASENLTRAKQFLSTFQRQKRLPGVVEHVSSGSRFRLLIPRENCRITFVLGGLRAPRAGRQGDKGEEGGEEALEWTSRRAYQRDVEFEVETTDRAGGFIGSLFVNGNNIGKGLLEEGLAWVQGGSGGQEFDDAESRAKQARKGIWKDWDESKEVEELKVVNNGEPPKPRKEFIDVVVTNMNDDGTFGVQIIGDSVHALDKLMKEFRAFHEAGSPAATTLRPGELVAAKFSADNEFYRAKIRKVDRSAQKADVVLPLNVLQ